MNHVKVVVDICCNHCGDYKIAKEMIKVAKECGADYVKMQKRDIDSISAEIGDKPYESINSFGKTYREHREALEFDKDQWYSLQEYAEDIVGIGFFATPFDVESLIFLSTELNVPFIKFGSTQIHDKQMKTFVKTFKHPPLIMSTGMCDTNVVAELVKELNPRVVMHTTSCYPCDESNVNLNVLSQDYKFTNFVMFENAERGLSGHYVSGNGAIEAAAVALGATWIERHFTLDRTWKGTDQSASLEPEGLRNVVKAVRTIERAMGTGEKKMLDCELPVWKKINNG